MSGVIHADEFTQAIGMPSARDGHFDLTKLFSTDCDEVVVLAKNGSQNGSGDDYDMAGLISSQIDDEVLGFVS